MSCASTRGRIALVCATCGVALMFLVGVAGPSAAQPYIGPPSWFPPLFRHLRPADVFVAGAVWAAIGLGTASVLLGLSAVRAGWRPQLRPLLAAAAIAAALLAAVPPTGSTDLTDYATYGRMAATGHSPYTTTPLHMRALHDPVARRSSHSWRAYTTVYGPLATTEQWAAAEVGGASSERITLGLKAVNALAFLFIAVALDRLIGPDRGRRTRAHLLWTLNPLVLWAVVAGGHIDGFAAALAVGGLWVLKPAFVRRRPLLAGLGGGLLLGGAGAVKLPFAMVAAAPAWTWRRSPRVLAGLVLGGVVALVPGYLIAGQGAFHSLTHRGVHTSQRSTWYFVDGAFGIHLSPGVVGAGAAVVFVLLALIFTRGLPDTPVRPALALALAWVLSSQVYYSWYEVLVLPLIALMPASRADWLVVCRMGVAIIGEGPGLGRGLHPYLIGRLSHELVRVSAVVLFFLGATLVVCALRRNWGIPEPEPAPALEPTAVP